MSLVHKTFITLEALVKYEILPEDKENDFPSQIDITEILVKSVNPDTGKTRNINIVNCFSEAEIINLEDEVLENDNEKI